MDVQEKRVNVAEGLIARLPKASDTNAPGIVREIRALLHDIEAHEALVAAPQGLRLVGAG